MTDAFFDVTKSSFESITKLCNLIHPISVSMWNMRVEINQMKEWVPDITNQQLGCRFLKDSGITGVDCITAFVDTTWEEHKKEIAWIFLTNLFAIYEGWLHGLRSEVFDGEHGNLSEKAMQFPDAKMKKEIDSSGNETETIVSNGIVEELERLTSDESQLLCNVFFETYAKKKHRCFVEDSDTNVMVLDKELLKNLLYCYRYFKELRNCYIHNAQLANDTLIKAYNDFAAKVVDASKLGMDEIPEHFVPAVGQPISVSLRGVIGFSHVIRMIMLTVDTKLLRSKYAEREFLRRLKNVYSNETRPVLNRNANIATQEIIGLAKKAGFRNLKFGVPGTFKLSVNFLVDNSIVRQMDYYNRY